MLAYTKNVKDFAGVKDSFTEEKTKESIEEEKLAKIKVEKYEKEHPEKQEEIIEKVKIEEEKKEKKIVKTKPKK